MSVGLFCRAPSQGSFAGPFAGLFSPLDAAVSVGLFCWALLQGPFPCLDAAGVSRALLEGSRAGLVTSYLPLKHNALLQHWLQAYKNYALLQQKLCSVAAPVVGHVGGLAQHRRRPLENALGFLCLRHIPMLPTQITHAQLTHALGFLCLCHIPTLPTQLTHALGFLACVTYQCYQRLLNPKP